MDESEKKLITKWAPIIEKCKGLSTDAERLFLAKTLDELKRRAAPQGTDPSTNLILEGETLNVVNPTGTKRLVIGYGGDGEFTVQRQRKDWVEDA